MGLGEIDWIALAQKRDGWAALDELSGCIKFWEVLEWLYI
jgi:hypothetical protein